MAIFLDERNIREQLFPFTHTRHVADIRIGILTIREKWAVITGEPVLTEKHPSVADLVVPANVLPTKKNVNSILEAARTQQLLRASEDIRIITYPWEIFLNNDWALRNDYELLTQGRATQELSAGNHCQPADNIFIEEGAVLTNCYLNAATGPIYIGKNAEIMEAAMIRGPFCAGEGSVVKMGAKIYGATTLGPFCVAGGEIKNAVLFGYSNKAHDGYLGDSVLGEWCNIGAGTSNSNVKNTGGVVKYIPGGSGTTKDAGQKAGLLMGDYSRAAINTSFNTGTIVGVCCNIFGTAPGKFINNFSWGSERYIFEKALTDIENWKKMKGQVLTAGEIQTLKDLYDQNL